MIESYRNAKPEHWKTLKANPRANRTELTPAEDCLWNAIRGSRLGFYFRRQHVFEVYILDFVCISALLVIELDGAYHDDPDQAAYDEARSRCLAQKGFRVLRFNNEEVLTGLEQVLHTIRQALELPRHE